MGLLRDRYRRPAAGTRSVEESLAWMSKYGETNRPLLVKRQARTEAADIEQEPELAR